MFNAEAFKIEDVNMFNNNRVNKNRYLLAIMVDFLFDYEFMYDKNSLNFRNVACPVDL